MNYVQISFYAEAYYSGNSYKEVRYLTQELWDKIKDHFPTTYSIHELDGKHSEVYGKFDIEENITEEDFKVRLFEDDNDGDHIADLLLDSLYYIIDGVEFVNIQNKVKTLCEMQVMTIRINKANREKILELFKENGVSVI